MLYKFITRNKENCYPWNRYQDNSLPLYRFNCFGLLSHNICPLWTFETAASSVCFVKDITPRSNYLHMEIGTKLGVTERLLYTLRLDECGGGLVTKSCLTIGTPWTVAHQGPLARGCSRQEYWVGCHCLLQGIFPTPEMNWGLLHFR